MSPTAEGGRGSGKFPGLLGTDLSEPLPLGRGQRCGAPDLWVSDKYGNLRILVCSDQVGRDALLVSPLDTEERLALTVGDVDLLPVDELLSKCVGLGQDGWVKEPVGDRPTPCRGDCRIV
jgi:hypothetical protein